MVVLLLLAAFAAVTAEKPEALVGVLKRGAAPMLANPTREAVGTAGKAAVDIAGKAAVVIDAGSGETLLAMNGDERMFPASTTKIMTALLALKYGELDDEIRVGAEIRGAAADESSADLREGDVLTLRDLLAGLLLPSGNDAARTIARYVVRRVDGASAGGDWHARFAALMNEESKRIGAVDTHFANPHGLHDPDHYSTAEDLARIAIEAMKLQAFRDIVSAESYRSAGGGKRFANRNKLLDDDDIYYYRGANGVKTGYTSAAGYCLVASARRDGREVVAVVLQSTAEGVWDDARALLDFGLRKNQR